MTTGAGDGEQRNVAAALVDKGMRFTDVPNLATAFGYTNAFRTLKTESTTQYVCRLRRYPFTRKPAL